MAGLPWRRGLVIMPTGVMLLLVSLLHIPQVSWVWMPSKRRVVTEAGPFSLLVHAFFFFRKKKRRKKEEEKKERKRREKTRPSGPIGWLFGQKETMGMLTLCPTDHPRHVQDPMRMATLERQVECAMDQES